MHFLVNKLFYALSKTSSKISSAIEKLFKVTGRKIDKSLLESIEDLLISSDMGVINARNIVARLAKLRIDYNSNVELAVKDLLSNENIKT